jgi:hypothetical protein
MRLLQLLTGDALPRRRRRGRELQGLHDPLGRPYVEAALQKAERLAGARQMAPEINQGAGLVVGVSIQILGKSSFKTRDA